MSIQLRARPRSTRREQREKRVSPITWAKRPSRHVDPNLGVCQRWWSGCRRYRIQRFPELTGRYLAAVRRPGEPDAWDLISAHRTLGGAKLACAAHQRLRRPR